MNLVGQTFGRLTALEKVGVDKWGDAVWCCCCLCGAIKEIVQGKLRSGDTKSCGCLCRDKPNNLIHGDTRDVKKTKEYRAWGQMKQRCGNKKNPRFSAYGGRGIMVNHRWLNSYENFLKDMGRAPSPQHSIERKNNNGNYTPLNCVWATRKQQTANRRCSV